LHQDTSLFVQLSRESHPAVQCRRTPSATGTGADADRIRRSLDHIAEAYFLILEEPRETNAVGLTLLLLLGFAC
jgi:hypothetical protein